VVVAVNDIVPEAVALALAAEVAVTVAALDAIAVEEALAALLPVGDSGGKELVDVAKLLLVAVLDPDSLCIEERDGRHAEREICCRYVSCQGIERSIPYGYTLPCHEGYSYDCG
jgi:hypothetical protein